MSSASENLRKLISLPSNVFLKEYTESRERFRNYLKASGIHVPDIIADIQQAGTGVKNSVMIDDFNAQSISSIDDAALIVYSTVGNFLKLFEKLPSSVVLEDITVTVEELDPCTAKDLKEQHASGKINADAQLVIASSDLKLLIPELGGAPKTQAKARPEKVAVLNEADIKELFEEKEKAEKSEKEGSLIESKPLETEKAKPAESEKSRELPPIITQDEFDALMYDVVKPVKAQAAPKKEPEPEEEKHTEGLIINADAINIEAKKPAAAAPKSAPAAPKPVENQTNANFLSQNELDNLLAPKQAAPKAAEKPADASLSQSELDALFSGKSTAPKVEEKPAEASLSQSELDALFSGKSTAPKVEEKPAEASLSQSELDALFSGKSTAPKAEEKPAEASLSQSELDALFSGKSTAPKAEEKPAEASLSQSELDALFSGKSTTPKAEEKPVEESAVSQEAIDALLTGKSEKVSIEEKPVSEPEPQEIPEEKDEDDEFSDKIDKMLSEEEEFTNLLAGKSVEKKEPGLRKMSAEGSMILSQEELDNIMASLPDEIKGVPEKTKKSDDPNLSQSELDELFGSKNDERKGFQSSKQGVKHNISQDELDALLAKHNK